MPATPGRLERLRDQYWMPQAHEELETNTARSTTHMATPNLDTNWSQPDMKGKLQAQDHALFQSHGQLS